MYHRRIDWKINLVYSTTLEQLKEICTKIDEFIKDYEGLVENEKQESFAKTVAFNSSSIDVQILCFTNPCNFTEFSTIKQDLVYSVIDIVRSVEVNLPFLQGQYTLNQAGQTELWMKMTCMLQR